MWAQIRELPWLSNKNLHRKNEIALWGRKRLQTFLQRFKVMLARTCGFNTSLWNALPTENRAICHGGNFSRAERETLVMNYIVLPKGTLLTSKCHSKGIAFISSRGQDLAFPVTPPKSCRRGKLHCSRSVMRFKGSDWNHKFGQASPWTSAKSFPNAFDPREQSRFFDLSFYLTVTVAREFELTWL